LPKRISSPKTLRGKGKETIIFGIRKESKPGPEFPRKRSTQTAYLHLPLRHPGMENRKKVSQCFLILLAGKVVPKKSVPPPERMILVPETPREIRENSR